MIFINFDKLGKDRKASLRTSNVFFKNNQHKYDLYAKDH